MGNSGSSIQSQGTYFEGGRATSRSRDRMAAVPCSPDQIDRSPTGNPVFHQQWCDCANDLAWLLVEYDRSSPQRPRSRAFTGNQSQRTVSRVSDILEYHGSLLLSQRRLQDREGRHRPLSHSGRRRYGLRLCLANDDTGTVGQTTNKLITRSLRQRALMGQKELDHPELCRFATRLVRS